MRFFAPRRPYTPERAYWTSVVPLGCLFAIGGPMMAAMVWLPMVHIGWLPFLSSDSAKRIAFVALGLFFAVIGVGLWRRSKIAWYAVFAYVGAGNAGIILGWLFDPTAPGEQSDFFVSGIPFNLLIATGIYFATRPAFRVREAFRVSDDRSLESSP